MKMEATCSFETPAEFQHNTRLCIADNRRCENLTSYKNGRTYETSILIIDLFTLSFINTTFVNVSMVVCLLLYRHVLFPWSR
jgi:hypothetical protein